MSFDIPELAPASDMLMSDGLAEDKDNLTMPSPFKRILTKTSGFDEGEDSNNYHEERIKRLHYLEYELSNLKQQTVIDKIDHEKQVAEYERTIRAKDEEIQTLNGNEKFLFEQNGELKQQLQDTKQNKADSLKQKDKLISELQRRLSSKSDEVTGLRYEIDSISSKNRILEEEQTLTIERLEGQVGILEQELKKQVEVNGEHVKKILDLQEQLDSARSVTEEESRDDNEDTKLLYKKQVNKQIDYINELENKVSNYESQVVKLVNSNKLVEVLKEERNLNLKKLDQMRKLSADYDSLSAKYSKAAKELSRWNELRSNSGESSQEFMNKVRLQEEENSNLKERVMNLSVENNKLAQSMRVKEEELESSKQVIENLKLENSKQSLMAMKANNEKRLLQQELEFNKNQIEFFDKENKLLLSKSENLNENWVQEREKIISESKALVDNYKSHFDQLQSQLNSFATGEKKRKFNDGPSKEQVSEEQVKKITYMELELEQSRNAKKLLEQTVSDLSKSLHDFQNAQNEAPQRPQGLENKSPEISQPVYDRLLSEQRRLQDDLFESSKKLQRLREAFEKQISRFNKIIYQLFSYKIEFESSAKIRLLSSRFGDSSLYLSANVVESGDDLRIEIQRFTGSSLGGLTEMVMQNLYQYWIVEKNDTACFLSALNMELFERQNVH